MKKSILCIAGVILLILLHGCNITITGLTSGYSKLSEEHREKVVFLDAKDNVYEQEKDGKIYAITGEQLRKCIETQENVIIYKWVPHCTGPHCFLLSYLQSYCDSHGYILYVVSSYYDSTRMITEQKNISLPLFSINEKYYKTKYCCRYTKLFVEDLLKDKKMAKEIWYKNTFIFNYGKLVSTSLHIEDEPDRWEVIKP